PVMAGIDDVADRKRFLQTGVMLGSGNGGLCAADGIAGEQLAADQQTDRARRVAGQFDDADARCELDLLGDGPKPQLVQCARGVFGNGGGGGNPSARGVAVSVMCGEIRSSAQVRSGAAGA